MPQHKFCTADLVRLSQDQFLVLSQIHRHSRGATLDLRRPSNAPPAIVSTAANTTSVIRTVADTRSGKQTLTIGFDGHVCSLPCDPGTVANALAFSAFVRDHPAKPLYEYTDRVACFSVFPDTATTSLLSPTDDRFPASTSGNRPAPSAAIADDGLPPPYVWCLVLSNSHPEHEMTAAVRVMSPDGHEWERAFTERDRPLVVRADSWTLVKMCEAHVLAPVRVVVEWYRMRTVNGHGAGPAAAAMTFKVDRFPSVFMDIFVVPKAQTSDLEQLQVGRASCIKSLWLTADECKQNQLLVPGNDNILDKLDATRFFYGHIHRYRKALRTNPRSAPASLIPPISDSTHPSWLHQSRSPIPQLDKRFQGGGPMHDFHMSLLLDSPPPGLATSSSPLRPTLARARAKRSALSAFSAAATSTSADASVSWQAPAAPAPTSAFVGLVTTMPVSANADAATTDPMRVPPPKMSRFTPPSGRFTPPGVRELGEQQEASPGSAASADSSVDTIVLLGKVFSGTGGATPERGVGKKGGGVELVDLVSSDDE